MKLKQTALFTATVSIMAIAFIMPAFAEGSFTSSGTIAFSAKGVTPPVDPEDPTEPQVPPEVPSTGQEGNLTLDVVPRPYFGVYPIPTINTTYQSKIVAGEETGQITAGAQTFIQVSDARPDEGVGWNVKVRADRFTNSEDPDNHINGAKIIFSAGEVRGPLAAEKPVSYEAVLNCTNDEWQNEVKIFVADSGRGMGTWVDCLYPTPWQSPALGSDNGMIQLFIPANSGAIENNTYYSNLMWTLSDAP